MHYPTRNGISIPVTEIWLPKSNLDPKKRENYNLHHNEWEKRVFGQNAILMTIRNLAKNQVFLLLDVHDYIHSNYSPPRPPTMSQGMAEIENAYDNHDSLRIRREGHYVLSPLTKEIMNRCIETYNRIADRKYF